MRQSPGEEVAGCSLRVGKRGGDGCRDEQRVSQSLCTPGAHAGGGAQVGRAVQPTCAAARRPPEASSGPDPGASAPDTTLCPPLCP